MIMCLPRQAQDNHRKLSVEGQQRLIERDWRGREWQVKAPAHTEGGWFDIFLMGTLNGTQ
jgi:hypothetical protein